jgi:hypothetical protein
MTISKYEFSLILTDSEVTDEQADAIYVAGCDDGFIVTRSGVTHINIYRESTSLEDAIKSATADLQKAGMQIARVELDPHVLTTVE